MATTLAMLESKATTAEKLILMLRQQIGEARAAQVEEDLTEIFNGLHFLFY